MDELITTNNQLQPQDMSVAQLSMQTREQSELQAGFVMAKRFPRNEEEAFVKITKAFSRPGLAEAAEYRFPRGKEEVRGATVDTARQLARCWGNLRYGFQVIDSTEEELHLKGYCLDLETNMSAQLEARFAKKVQRKVAGGGTVWLAPNERDLRELVNKHGSMLIRNCILQIIPSDIVDDAVSTARKTLKVAAERGLSASKEDTIRALVVGFDKIGVSVSMLETKLGHAMQEISPDEIVELRGVYKSLVDGNSKREEHFSFSQPDTDAEPKGASIAAKIKGA